MYSNVPILFFLLAHQEHLWNKRITAVQYQPQFHDNDRRAPVIHIGVSQWPEKIQPP